MTCVFPSRQLGEYTAAWDTLIALLLQNKHTYSHLHLWCGFVAECFDLSHSLVLATSLLSANLFTCPMFIPLPQHPVLKSLILLPHSRLPSPAHCLLESSSMSVPSLRTGHCMFCKSESEMSHSYHPGLKQQRCMPDVVLCKDV